jgi:hypothetical protein
MELRRAIAERVLSCMLALLAALQPALAGQCFCPCKQDRSRDCAAQCTSDCQKCSCHCETDLRGCTDEAPCRGNDPTESFSISWLLIQHPCQCPVDCECHLRHSPTIHSPPNTGLRLAKQQLDKSDACMPGWPDRNGKLPAGLNWVEFGIRIALRAPTSCAVLCRFTI